MKHVYVHVPFCGRRCTYCDFSIAVRRDTPSDHFVAAVLTEHDLRRHGGNWDDAPPETLYFGGGTPSRLSVHAITNLVHTLAPGVKTSRVEVTLEANPEDVTPESAEGWAAAGVNRVSLGIQSFDPGVLAWMHRSHSPEASGRAVLALRDAGIRSVSGDLIFGLPGSLGRDTAADLARIGDMDLDHVSIYGLTVEQKTALGHWVDRGVVAPADEDRYAAEFLEADRRLTARGFRHYEVSNFAKPGHESRHNQAYWSGASYQGLGPAAHRFVNGVRSWNIGPWAAYERRVADQGDPTEGSEWLTEDQVQLERLYLSLRTSDGLNDTALSSAQVVARLIDEGSAQQAGPVLRLTPAGWLRLDEIVTVLATNRVGEQRA